MTRIECNATINTLSMNKFFFNFFQFLSVISRGMTIKSFKHKPNKLLLMRTGRRKVEESRRRVLDNTLLETEYLPLQRNSLEDITEEQEEEEEDKSATAFVEDDIDELFFFWLFFVGPISKYLIQPASN